jgi:predicted ArsR family transcriptional regulator
MQRTRQEILELLRRKGELTVRDLAQELELTQMSVRLHLSVLARDGLLKARQVHQPVGRPYFAYTLTERADDLFPKAYWRLAERLLDAVEQRCGAGAVEQVLDGVIEGMEARYADRLSGKSLEARVETLVAILCEEGFMAESESAEGGFVVRANNCPYARVARSHPDLCGAECSFICRCLTGDDANVAVERTMFRLDGDACCSYSVQRLGSPPVTPARV